MPSLLSNFYFLFLIFSAAFSIFILKRKCFKLPLLTIFTFLFFGLFFELYFFFNPRYIPINVIKIYDIIFPIFIIISFIVRYLNDYFLKILIFFVVEVILYFRIYILDYISINYILSISLLLFLTIKSTLKNSLKLLNLVDIIIAIDLYYMLISSIITYREFYWSGSFYLKTYQLSYYIFLFLTLILINVKFWRSLTH